MLSVQLSDSLFFCINRQIHGTVYHEFTFFKNMLQIEKKKHKWTQMLYTGGNGMCI